AVGLGARPRASGRDDDARLLLTEARQLSPPGSRWIAAGGAFVVSLDSMANIAFPAMALAFALPPDAMRLGLMCYVLPYSFVAFAGGHVTVPLRYRRGFDSR